MSDQDRAEREHRELREMLGSLVLGGLTGDESVALQAHLDGCPACRAELAEIAPLAGALRSVDVAGLVVEPAPSPGLGERVVAQVAAERRDRDRSRHRRLLAAAAVLVVALGGAVGVAELRGGADPAPVLAAGQEPIALLAEAPGIGVRAAVLVPHTWGLEVRMTMTGVHDGERYRAVAVARDGRQLAAGEFLGVADRPVVCSMQSALLRSDARAFLVLDADGRTVAEADLPA